MISGMDAGRVALIWADRLARAAEDVSLGGASDVVNPDSYPGPNGRQIGRRCPFTSQAVPEY